MLLRREVIAVGIVHIRDQSDSGSCRHAADAKSLAAAPTAGVEGAYASAPTRHTLAMAEYMLIHTGDVPILLRPAGHTNSPIVVLYHGFGPPNSPQQMAEAFPLAALDASLAYVGLPLFGERLPAGGIEEVMDRQARDYLRQLLLPVVEQAADELATVVTQTAERTSANTNALGLLGFSAGGVVVAAALIRAQIPTRAAVLVNTVSSPAAAVALTERLSGSPYSWDSDARAAAYRADLAAHATALAARPGPAALAHLARRKRRVRHTLRCP